MLATAAGTLSFRQVSAGGHHTCGVTVNDLAYCWGDGRALGAGIISYQLRPVAVLGGLRFREVSAGFRHTCGVTTDNRAYCWGPNTTGALGTGIAHDHWTPTAVAGALRFRQVSAGNVHTCGVTTGDAAYCWGSGFAGQLGYGTSEPGTDPDRKTPIAVAGGLRFRQVSAGNFYTCGTTTANVAYCWGHHGTGGLGQRTSSTPAAIPGRLSFRHVVAYFGFSEHHTCGVTTGDLAYCWGDNDSGQLGDGTSSFRRNPVAVAGGLKFRQVSVGNTYTCGTTTGKRVYCWGYNRLGQLGDGTLTNRSMPVAVASGLQFSGVSAGHTHSCGVSTDNRAYCWGYNLDGQLGDGTELQRRRPVAVVGTM